MLGVDYEEISLRKAIALSIIRIFEDYTKDIKFLSISLKFTE